MEGIEEDGAGGLAEDTLDGGGVIAHLGAVAGEEFLGGEGGVREFPTGQAVGLIVHEGEGAVGRSTRRHGICPRRKRGNGRRQRTKRHDKKDLFRGPF